jgi:hypothetical protein
VVRTKMHSFRPDDPRQKLHSRKTTMGKNLRSDLLSDRFEASLQPLLVCLDGWHKPHVRQVQENSAMSVFVRCRRPQPHSVQNLLS